MLLRKSGCDLWNTALLLVPEGEARKTYFPGIFDFSPNSLKFTLLGIHQSSYSNTVTKVLEVSELKGSNDGFSKHRLRSRPEKIKSRISDKPLILHCFSHQGHKSYVPLGDNCCDVKKRNILTSLTSRHLSLLEGLDRYPTILLWLPRC